MSNVVPSGGWPAAEIRDESGRPYLAVSPGPGLMATHLTVSYYVALARAARDLSELESGPPEDVGQDGAFDMIRFAEIAWHLDTGAALSVDQALASAGNGRLIFDVDELARAARAADTAAAHARDAGDDGRRHWCEARSDTAMILSERLRGIS